MPRRRDPPRHRAEPRRMGGVQPQVFRDVAGDHPAQGSAAGGGGARRRDGQAREVLLGNARHRRLRRIVAAIRAWRLRSRANRRRGCLRAWPKRRISNAESGHPWYGPSKLAGLVLCYCHVWMRIPVQDRCPCGQCRGS